MEIWEPKPPGTLWATPGLLRDCFTFLHIHLLSNVFTFPRDPEAPAPRSSRFAADKTRFWLIQFLTICSALLLQSVSWDVGSSSTNRRISSIFWNPFSLQTATCPCPEPDQFIPRFSQSKFLKIHFNIILPSALRPSSWPLSFRFPHQNPLCTYPLFHTLYMPHPFQTSWFDHPTNIWINVSYQNFSMYSCSQSCIWLFLSLDSSSCEIFMTYAGSMSQWVSVASTGVLIIPWPDLLPDVFCLMVIIFRLMLVLLYI